jgi:hypothetical protein
MYDLARAPSQFAPSTNYPSNGTKLEASNAPSPIA